MRYDNVATLQLLSFISNFSNIFLSLIKGVKSTYNGSAHVDSLITFPLTGYRLLIMNYDVTDSIKLIAIIRYIIAEVIAIEIIVIER